MGYWVDYACLVTIAWLIFRCLGDKDRYFTTNLILKLLKIPRHLHTDLMLLGGGSFGRAVFSCAEEFINPEPYVVRRQWRAARPGTVSAHLSVFSFRCPQTKMPDTHIPDIFFINLSLTWITAIITFSFLSPHLFWLAATEMQFIRGSHRPPYDHASHVVQPLDLWKLCCTSSGYYPV